MKLAYKTLVQSVVFDSIPTDADEDFTFKLEIFRKPDGKFSGQLYRQEMYNFQCTFIDFQPSEMIYVFDFISLPELDEKEFASAEACLQYTVKRLEEEFFL